MIKANVITNNASWYRFIKNPDYYIYRKLNKLSSVNKNLMTNNIYFKLLLSGEKYINNLNKKFRKKNKSTDVLSFPFYTKKELKKKLLKEKDLYLGDIIINLKKISKNKKLSDFKSKFDKLWVHGLIHLFGYDHKKDKDYLIMNKIEEKYINLING